MSKKTVIDQARLSVETASQSLLDAAKYLEDQGELSKVSQRLRKNAVDLRELSPIMRDYAHKPKHDAESASEDA